MKNDQFFELTGFVFAHRFKLLLKQNTWAITVKFINIRTPEKLLSVFLNLNKMALPYGNASKRYRRYCKQSRRWSDSSVSSLFAQTYLSENLGSNG